MKKLFGIVLGILVIAVGVLFALDALGVMTAEISFDGWWTLFIIVPGICSFWQSKDKIGSAIWVLIGILLFFAAQGFYEYDIAWKMILTLVIISAGIKLIKKSLGVKGEEVHGTDSGETTECMAMFSSKESDYSGNDVMLARVGAVFGGAKCNLSNAKLCNGAQLNVFCLFGGADIVVPENVQVKINTFCLFGGVADKRAVKKYDEQSIVLNINGFCIFGGADIK